MTEGARSQSPPLPPDPYEQVDPAEASSMESPSEATGASSMRGSATSATRQSHASNVSRDNSRRSLDGPLRSRSRPISVSEVVEDAFQHSPATHQVNPEIINLITAQVTEQVMRNLTQQQPTPSMSEAPITSPSTHFFYPPPPGSPTQDSVDSRHRIFTPPPPDLEFGGQEDRGVRSLSPDHPISDSDSQFSHESRHSVRSGESIRSADMPRPVKTESSSTIRQDDSVDTRSSKQRSSESTKTTRDRPPNRRDSKTSEAGPDGTSRQQPPKPQSGDEPTPLERTWQPLFTGGKPTKRLGQFLQGLALHLIEGYEPQRSLVVTPPKMLRFFKETQVNEEHYPWEIIFSGKMAFGSVSHMYQKLLCEHHFVQNGLQEYPSIPGLTPYGFELFMTYLIQAHPDTEYERLTKAVMNMPISNADQRAERFPKELPRRLLPAEINKEAQQKLASSLDHEVHVLAEVKGNLAMPPLMSPAPAVQRPSPSSFNERDRQPRSQRQHSNAVDDEDLNLPSVPIERERKPYTAKEGTGRFYQTEDGRTAGNQSWTEQSGVRPSRTNSGLPAQAIFPPNSPRSDVGRSDTGRSDAGQSDPVNIPTRNPHRMSTGHVNIPPPPPYPPAGVSSAHPSKLARGRSSPPPLNTFARSGTDLSGGIPNQQFGSPLQPVQSNPVTGQRDDEALRRYQNRPRPDRYSNASGGNDDTSGARNIAIPNRPAPNTNAFEYGSLGGPVGGPPPLGSSHPSNRAMPPPPNAYDDRRRSMYPASSGFQGGSDGGTDGYGSFAGGVNGGYAHSPQQPYGSSQH